MQTEAASHLASLGFQKQKFWFVLGLNTNQRWEDKVDHKIPGSWHQLLPAVTSSSYSLFVHILLKHSWKHRARGQSRAAHLWCVTPHAWQTLVAHFTGSHSGTELDGCSSRCRGVGQLSRRVSFKKWASDVVPLKQCLPKKSPLATVSVTWTVLLRTHSVCREQQGIHWGSRIWHKTRHSSFCG